MRLVYEHEKSASVALFAIRQLRDILAQPPFDAFDVADLTLRVRAQGVPGAWYDREAREIVVDVALYDHALLLLTELFTSPPSPTGLPLVEAAKAYDTMLALFATRNYQESGSYSHGFGPNHWVNGHRITHFEAFVVEHLETNPEFAAPIDELDGFFGPSAADVALRLSTHLDECVDIARFFFVFVCLHELGHHVYVQDQSLRTQVFEIVGQVAERPPVRGDDSAPDAFAVPDEERYADAFAVIGVAMCKETSLSGEQFLFVRAFFEFVVGTLIDTTIFLEEIFHSARYADNHLLKFLRFDGLRDLQHHTSSILDKWEVAVRRTRSLEEHYLTSNPAFRRFDFYFLARLHAQWIEQSRRAIEEEGRAPGVDDGI